MAEEQSGNEINVETVAPMAPVMYRRTAISGDVGVEKPRNKPHYHVLKLLRFWLSIHGWHGP